MHELAHEYASRKVSPWGGLKLFQQVYAQSNMRERLTELDLPYPGSNRGYDPIDIIEGFMTSVVLGARRREHSGMLRTDAVVHQESAEVGYNREKKGRRSHHPLMAFCDELKMVVNAWMRSGDSSSSVDSRPNPGRRGLLFGEDPTPYRDNGCKVHRKTTQNDGTDGTHTSGCACGKRNAQRRLIEQSR